MTTVGSDNEFPKLLLVEGAAPAAPAAGRVKLYAKADGLLYWKDDAGTEYAVATGSGGDVATDAIWDAAGDLAVGSGPNAAAKLAVGSDGDVLTVVTGAPAWAAPSGGGGLEDYGQGFHVGDLLPTSPGTYDEEFEGTADTLPANWSWADNTPTFYLNSRLPSWLYVDRGADTTTTYTLRRSSFSPGTGTAWGVWARIVCGGRGGGYNWATDLYVLNSDNSEGRGIGLIDTSAVRTGNVVASSEGFGGGALSGPGIYLGITRDASDKWRGYVSSDGISWVCVMGAGSSGVTHAFTPARIELRMRAQYGDAAPGRHGIDFIRFRTDTDFPRP